MTKIPKRPRDVNQLAKMMVDIASGEGKPEAKQDRLSAAERGRLGGLKGGKRRADALSKSEKSAIAKKAAKSRWAQ